MTWHNLEHTGKKEWVCGFCNSKVADDYGYYHSKLARRIHICPGCDRPTFFDMNGAPTPGIMFGNAVAHLPSDIESLYNEARRCYSVSAYTSSVLSCRKMLMNIAVNHGEPAGKSFVEYINFLANNGFIPPNGKAWVDYIRTKGNEATHEIALMTQDDAGKLIRFTEMLLKFIYEFPKIAGVP